MDTHIKIGKYSLLYLPQIDSTNRYALKNLQYLPDGQVILAEKQTLGYGRLGRKWISSVPDNIYMSLVIKPSVSHAQLSCLTQYMSIAICDVISEYHIIGELKWPNDVLVRGAKIAGILGESSYRGSIFRGYVLGTGINLNMSSEDLEGLDKTATSISLLLGRHINRDDFLVKLLNRFFHGFDQFIQEGFRSIRNIYSRRSLFLGKKITVTSPCHTISGTASHFLDDGALILVTEDGEEISITAGDVSIR